MNSFSKKEAITFGWGKFKQNWTLLVGVFAFIGVLSFAFESIDEDMYLPAFLLVMLVGILVQTWLEMGATRIVLDVHDDKDVEFRDLFGQASLLWRFLFAEILAGIIVFVGLLLFIIPGVIAAVGLFLIPYIVIDKGLGPVEAIKDSWRLTKGHKWNIFWFIILLILLNLVGALAFGVGLLATLPVSFVATVYVYRWLDKQDTPVVQTEEINSDE